MVPNMNNFACFIEGILAVGELIIVNDVIVVVIFICTFVE